MNGQARALIESMPNDIGTEAVGPLSFDEAFTLHHRAVFRRLELSFAIRLSPKT